MKKLIFATCSLLSLQLTALEYEIQFENEQISIAKAIVSPHEEIGLHRDLCPQIVIALKGGTITRLEVDGRVTEVVFPTGKSVYRHPDPEGELHRSVNNSSESIELIIVQLKK